MLKNFENMVGIINQISQRTPVESLLWSRLCGKALYLGK